MTSDNSLNDLPDPSLSVLWNCFFNTAHEYYFEHIVSSSINGALVQIHPWLCDIFTDKRFPCFIQLIYLAHEACSNKVLSLTIHAHFSAHVFYEEHRSRPLFDDIPHQNLFVEEDRQRGVLRRNFSDHRYLQLLYVHRTLWASRMNLLPAALT